MEPTYTAQDLDREAKSALLNSYILGCNPAHRTLKGISWNIRHAAWGLSLSTQGTCTKCGALRTSTVAM